VKDRGKICSKGIWEPLAAIVAGLLKHHPAILAAGGVLAAMPGFTIDRKRATNALPRLVSAELDLWPGIRGSMNSLRNSWSDARVVNNFSSSMVNFTVMFVMHSPGRRPVV